MTAHLSGRVAVIRHSPPDIRPAKRALPLKLWLELEDSVNRHKAEIAQNFAEARARLLPEPKALTWTPPPWVHIGAMRSVSMDDLANAGMIRIINPDDYRDSRGLFGLGFLGL